MNAKQTDKVMTTILYIISTVIVLLLAGFIGYILFKGRFCLNFNFLFGSPKVEIGKSVV